MKKRGVSPLIASVLLIAFVILLFVLVSTWVRRTAVEPSMASAEKKLASALECINTKIDIIDVCHDTTVTPNQIQVKVDNVGDTTLIGVGVRVIGDLNTSELEEILDDTSPYSRLSGVTVISGGYTVGDYGTRDTWDVEVYPKIKTGICGDAKKIKKEISECST